jgi:hypothetical protein
MGAPSGTVRAGPGAAANLAAASRGVDTAESAQAIAPPGASVAHDGDVADKQDPSRLDRELMELLNEVRVVLPGVSVLFAFLLTVPFTSGFAKLDLAQRDIFFALFLVTLASMLCLMTPSAYHRLRFREHAKEGLLRYSNVLVIVGQVLVGVAFVLAVFLMTSLLFDARAAWITSSAVGLVATVLWFGVPLGRRQASGDS